MTDIDLSFALLQSRYADDDDDQIVSIEPPVAHSPGLASPTVEHAPIEPALFQSSTAHPEAASSNETPQPEAVGVEEEFYDEDDDDEEIGAALEWADLRDDNRLGGGSAGYNGHAGYRPNAGGASANRQTALQPRNNNMQKLDSRFNGGSVKMRYDDPTDMLQGANMSSHVANEVKASANKEMRTRVRGVDKSDRATVEQAIDPRTRMVLFKMLNRGIFKEINGCVSTGKEANVYHATPGPAGGNTDLAIKIYKTSILVFKDRDRYVSGDFRFRNGYCKSNPRKMVTMWAEKELRNLMRLKAAGINAPTPFQLRMHVLVMEFLGEDGVAAPRLKDAGLPLQRMRTAYCELLLVMRALYQTCKLVHGDLSEYNILYHLGELYIIDVSQSVDLDHPKAFDFLREDCKHVNDYFRKNGVATLTVRELFDFVVDPNINDSNIDEALERLSELAASRPVGVEETPEESSAAALFQQAYIPRRLEEVVHYERDHERLTTGGNTDGLYYQMIAGMKQDLSGAEAQPAVLQGSAGQTGKQQQSEANGDASASPSSRSTLASGAESKGVSSEGGEGATDSQPAGGAAGKERTTHGKTRKTKHRGAGVDSSQEGGDSPHGGDASSNVNETGSGPAGGVRFAASSEAGPEAGESSEAAWAAAESRSRAAAGGSSGSSDDSSSGSGSDSDDEEGGGGRKGYDDDVPVDREALKAARKEHKKAIKEENREKRKVKTPKHKKKSKSKGNKK
ncbi:MAG: hypothetical protein WDW36_003774 [Sanguina aurantia]